METDRESIKLLEDVSRSMSARLVAPDLVANINKAIVMIYKEDLEAMKSMTDEARKDLRQLTELLGRFGPSRDDYL